MRVRNLIGSTLFGLLIALSGPALLACDRDEGPLEETGESIDDAADEAEDELD